MQRPGVMRRLASMLYESLLLLAVWFIAGFLFVGLTRGANSPLVIGALQAYILAVTAAYFLWFWLHGGQTLAMKTWRLKLVNAGNHPLGLRQAALRFMLALPSVLLGIGILWALVDRDRQFLHDRLAGTRLVETGG